MKNIQSLDDIFAITDQETLFDALRRYLSSKQYEHKQSLTSAELVYFGLARMGSDIVGDGFICLFCELYSPEFFMRLCDALAEAGGLKQRDLLLEAFELYTQGKKPISIDELHDIPMDSFNSEENMDRFDQIGDEVMEEIRLQYDHKKFWPVEYAMIHRHEFEPIK